MTAILDLKGQPIQLDGKSMTVSDCCISALVHLFPNEDLKPDEKLLRYKLAMKLTTAGEELPPLTSEEITEIKKVVAKFWNVLVMGRVYEAIDPASVKV